MNHFLEDGQVVNVLSEFEGGYVVASVYEREDDEPFEGEPFIVRNVYDEPPVGRLVDAMIVKTEKKLKKAKDELNAARESMRELSQERKLLESQCGINAALKRVYDFLVVGITHVVEVRYGEVLVIDVKTTKCGDDEHSRDLKLISLFGGSKGDLEWRIHKYSDGSGCQDTLCFPFTSLADAEAFAKTKALELLLDDENHWKESTVKSVTQLGVDVPEEVTEFLRARKINTLRSQYAEASQKAASYEKSLRELSESIP